MTKCGADSNNSTRLSKAGSSSTVCHALSCCLPFWTFSILLDCSDLAICACDSASAWLLATLCTPFPLALAGWFGWSREASSFLNSSSLYSSRNSSIWAQGLVSIFKSFQSWPISKSVTIVASLALNGISSACSIKPLAPRPLIKPICFNILSISPYSTSKSFAVFLPIPGTPLMPSEASPIKVKKSIIWFGLIPNFSMTAWVSVTLPVKLSSNMTQSLTSCIMSLSPVEITTWWPCSTARCASVPIMSSASAPSMRNKGIPSAVTKRWI